LTQWRQWGDGSESIKERAMKTLLQKPVILPLAIVCSVVNGVYAQGVSEAVGPGAMGSYVLQIVGYISNGTIGWDFTSSQDIEINSLGLLAQGSGPVPGATVGLWAADGTLLRSTGIDDNPLVINGNVYEAVDPLYVSAGTTLVIGAGSTGTINIVTDFNDDNVQSPIKFSATAYLPGGGLAFPPVYDSTDKFVAAATFLFEVVPEPNGFVLTTLGAGLIYLFGPTRRRLIMR
jgi:hypothetical protein